MCLYEVSKLKRDEHWSLNLLRRLVKSVIDSVGTVVVTTDPIISPSFLANFMEPSPG